MLLINRFGMGCVRKEDDHRGLVIENLHGNY